MLSLYQPTKSLVKAHADSKMKICCIFKIFFEREGKSFWKYENMLIILSSVFFTVDTQELTEQVECMKMKDETMTSTMQVIQKESEVLNREKEVRFLFVYMIFNFLPQNLKFKWS